MLPHGHRSIAAALCDPTSNEATSQKRRNPAGRGRFALGLRCSVGRVSPWIHSLPRASPEGKTALCKLSSIPWSGEWSLKFLVRFARRRVLQGWIDRERRRSIAAVLRQRRFRACLQQTPGAAHRPGLFRGVATGRGRCPPCPGPNANGFRRPGTEGPVVAATGRAGRLALEGHALRGLQGGAIRAAPRQP